jgi:hypothetical protein
MRVTRIVALLLAPVGIWAQSAIAPPQLGFATDGARALRPVYGVAGSFVLGPAVAGDVAEAAFSGSLGLFKAGSSLAAFDAQGKLLGSIEVPSGDALFAFSAEGSAALAYLTSTKTLMEWCGGEFTPVPLDTAPMGDVIGIAFPTAAEAVLIVERERGLWELHVPTNGAGVLARSALPGLHAPVLPLAAGGLLYTKEGAIVIRGADGAEMRLAASLPAEFSLEQMSRDWVELSDVNSAARFAIRTTPGREGFYRLPEQSPGPSR